MTRFVFLLGIILWQGIAQRLDISEAEIITYEKKGLLLERVGTLISYPNTNVMGVVVSLERLKRGGMCDDRLQLVDNNYLAKIDKFKNMTNAIFQASSVLNTDEICKITNSCNETEHSRPKRAVGAVLASIAMGIAGASLALSTFNKIELEKLSEFAYENAKRIDNLEYQLKHTREKQKVILDTQTSLIGYVKELYEGYEVLREQMECVTRYTYYSEWAHSLLHEIENALQFILRGTTFGNLTPSLIEPSLLKKFIHDKGGQGSQILLRYPNILYQTAIANLVKVDLDWLQFTYLIVYPQFDRQPIFPCYAVKQTGAMAIIKPNIDIHMHNHTNISHTTNNSGTPSTCVMHDMPEFAIVRDNSLQVLETPQSCKLFGKIMVCSGVNFRTTPLDVCLGEGQNNITHRNECPIIPCPFKHKDRFVSVSGGILIRTHDTKLSVVYSSEQSMYQFHETALNELVEVPPSQTVFVPWSRNISSISFGETVVYSPKNAHNVAKVHKILGYRSNINFTQLLDLPELGSQKMADLLTDRDQKLQELDNEMEWQMLTFWNVTKTLIPSWMKKLMYVFIVVIISFIVYYIYKCARKYQASQETHIYDTLSHRSICPSTSSTVRMRYNPLYPAASISSLPSNATALRLSQDNIMHQPITESIPEIVVDDIDHEQPQYPAVVINRPLEQVKYMNRLPGTL